MTEKELKRRALEKVQEMLAPLTVYKVEKILGDGGTGRVLLVRHRVLGLRAMKLVHSRLLQHRVIRERFDNEARVMAALNHPNVVKVHDMGEVNGHPYIVMDFLEGGTLEDHLGEFGAMPPKQTVRVAVAILRGLQAAHDAGVVHRDIKPGNILFDALGTPKIADFGIARVDEGTRSLTREGSTMGTYAYMPPEQLAGEFELVDHRADIHAVGVTLYVMLTCGKLGQEAFFHQIKKYPGRLDSIPNVLQAVIRIATSEKPESRFSTAAAMADELETYIATGLPEDPADTPALGSAPAVKARKDPVLDALDPQALRVGATMVPAGPTRAQPGHEGAALVPSQGIVFEEQPADREPAYTINPEVDDVDAEAAERAIRQAAKRRIYRRVVLPTAGLLLVLMVGVGVWFATRPEPIVEVEPVIDTVIEPVIPAVTQAVTSSMPAAVTLIAEPTPQPTPVTVVKPSPTPKVVVRPQPEAVVMVQERAQVRLILKPDTNATVTLSGDGGTFTLSGGSREVPQGTYRVSVYMPGREAPQTGTLTVTPGLTVVTCDERFKMCTGFK